jgi:curli biogenesis system outer membrane secretion channel CsgG
VTLHYRIIDTSTGETVFSGEATGKSSDIADLKVGTSGTKVGIQLADEKGLLKEAVLNALKETGLF